MTVNVIYRNLFSHLSDALCGRAGAALRWALLFGGDVQSVSQSVGGETRRGAGDRKAGWTEQKRFGSPCVADFEGKRLRNPRAVLTLKRILFILPPRHVYSLLYRAGE